MSDEDTDLDLPIEITARGSPEMSESIVWGVAKDIGISVKIDRPISESSCLSQLVIAGETLGAGYVRVQRLPLCRTLVSMWPKDPNDEVNSSMFASFCMAVLWQFARLGFIELPAVPRAPLGFRRRPEVPDREFWAI